MMTGQKSGGNTFPNGWERPGGDQEPHLMYLMLQIGVFRPEILHPRLSRSEDGPAGGIDCQVTGNSGLVLTRIVVIYKDSQHHVAAAVGKIYIKTFL